MSISKLDLYVGASATGSLTLILAVALLYFFLRERASGISRPEDGSFFYRYYRWCVRPVVLGLSALGVTPNMITGVSLILALGAAALIGTGWLFTGVFVLTLSSTCDVMDGVLARAQGISSRAGAFFDSFADRLAEGIIFAGIAYYGQGGALTWTAIVALIASFAVSYARARGQSVGVDIKDGLMQRPARLVATIFAVLFAGIGHALPWESAGRYGDAILLGMIGVVGVLSLVTAWRRASLTMAELNVQDGLTQAVDSPTSGPEPLISG